MLFRSDGVTSSVPHVKSGKFRVLANMSNRPIAPMPGLPNINETPGLSNYEFTVWLGLVAPAGTPKPVVDLLYRKIAEGLRSSDVGQRFADDGSEPVGSTPEQFAAHIKNEVAKNAKLVKASGMRDE